MNREEVTEKLAKFTALLTAASIPPSLLIKFRNNSPTPKEHCDLSYQLSWRGTFHSQIFHPKSLMGGEVERRSDPTNPMSLRRPNMTDS